VEGRREGGLEALAYLPVRGMVAALAVLMVDKVGLCFVRLVSEDAEVGRGNGYVSERRGAGLPRWVRAPC
jgi:hypothetical protein